MNKDEFIKEYSNRSMCNLNIEDWDPTMDRSFKRDGPTKKLHIAQEELAELIQAISKYIREIPEANMLVLEELADVYIVMTYITEACDFTKENLFSAIDVKIEREKKRLDNLEKMDEFYGIGY